MTMFCPQCKMEVVVKNGCCQICGLVAAGLSPFPDIGFWQRREPDSGKGEGLPRSRPEEVGGTHYQQGLQVTPWDLQKTMKSTGLSYADGRIFDVIKYVWRDKGGMAKRLEDLRKARHCLDEAIKALEGKQPSI